MAGDKMEYRKLTKYPGVYERESDKRTHKSKPDICFDISYKVEEKKIWEKVGWLSEGYSPKLAADVRSERIRSIRHGEELPHQRKKALLFKDLAKKYLEWAEENKKSAFSDKHRYKNHLASRFDTKGINEISSFDLEKMKSELSKEGLAPATVKHCLVLFRTMINKAIIWKLYEGLNPIKGVKLPTVQNQRERFLSYEEADLLLNALRERSETLHNMALLSLHCGLRAGEIFNLKGHDLDFQHDIITILDPKNTRPKKSYMTRAVKEKLRERIKEIPDSYIFTQRSGERFNEVPKLYREIADKLFNAGIKDSRQRVTFHTLRHTFASWLALQGESLFTIRELLGHKSFAMTQRYAHLIPDEKRRAAVMLEKVFSEKRNGVAAGE
jgi:integrase